MGNEMSNSNTSGLQQEEENSTNQVLEKSVQEAGDADSAEVENHNAALIEVEDHRGKDNGVATDVQNGSADPHVKPEREEKETEVQPPTESLKVEVESNSIGASDESNEMEPNSIMSDDSKEHEKLPSNTDGAKVEKEINSLSSDVPKEAGDPHILELISDEREQETEVLAPAESPNFEVKTNNEAGCKISDTHPTPPFKHSEDPEAQQESIFSENLPPSSDHQLEKQTSFKKEEDGINMSTSETVSSWHDPEPQEFEDLKFDKLELAKIPDDPPTQDSNESMHIQDDILGSNLNWTSEENGNPIGDMISNDLDGTVVSGSNPEVEMEKDDLGVKETTSEEEVSCKDNIEIKDGDEIGNGFGDGIKCNGQIRTERSPVSTDSPKAESEVTSMDESLNPHIEVFESTNFCVVLAAETTLTEKESEKGDDKPGGYTTQSGQESVKESKADSENVCQSDLLMIETKGENNQKRIEDFTCRGGNEDCIEEAKVGKNVHLVDGHNDEQNEASVESFQDSQKEAEMVPESGIVSTESSLTDCKREEVSEKRQIIEEIEEKTIASYGIQNNAEGRESGEQGLPHFLLKALMEQEEVSLSKAPVPHVQPQDNQQNNEMQSKNTQSSNDSMSELKSESNGDFLVAEASGFGPKNLMAETSYSAAELAIEKPEQAQHIAKIMMVAGEANTQVNNLSEQCAKVEMPAFASDDYQVQESVGRFSTESNSSNSNTHALMQKSPSFGLDLRIEARTEESDRTPLLCQDKTATGDFSGEQEVSLISPIAHTHYDQDKLQYQAMPVEEKVVRMERSDSEKSKTPFLGLLKEEEDDHIIVTPQKHETINAAAKKANKESLNLHTKEVTASREKRKPRSSLFTTCMCCTTVTN